MSALPAFAKNCGQLRCIPGAPPDLREPPRGDPFAPRNPYALAIDYEEEPPLFHLGGEHYAASWLCDPRAPEISAPIRLHCHAGVTGGEAGE